MVIMKKQSKTILMAFFTIVFGNIAVGHAEFGPFARAGETDETGVVPINFGDWDFAQETAFFVDAKYGHSIALTPNKKVFAWGQNNYGQLGDGSGMNSSIPIDITDRIGYEEDEVVTMISVGGEHSIALTSYNRVFIWGSNVYGQLGYSYDGTYPGDITFQFGLSEGEFIVMISAGFEHSLALSSFGRIFAWGRNNYRQVGPLAIDSYPVPTDITSDLAIYNQDEKVTKIFSGGNQSLALTDMGSIFVWGENYDDYNNTARRPSVEYRFFLNMGENIDKVSIWGDKFLALTSQNRALYEDPESSANQMYGNPQPQQISYTYLGIDEKITNLSSGPGCFLMVTDLGNVIGWGDNSQGQIKWGGDPSYPFFIDITSDFWIDTDETIIDVFAGLSFSIAVTSLGRIFAWGEAYGNPYPIEITSLFYD